MGVADAIHGRRRGHRRCALRAEARARWRRERAEEVGTVRVGHVRDGDGHDGGDVDDDVRMVEDVDQVDDDEVGDVRIRLVKL